MEKRFDGKVAIVTGGASGIGFATAEALLDEGGRVVVADIHTTKWLLSSWAGQKYLGTVLVVLGDAAQSSFCEEVVQKTVEVFGGVDILINNVGIQPLDSYKRVEDLDEETWNRIIQVNLSSHFLMSKYAIPEMRKRGCGAIVNVASVQGILSMPRVAAYSASKAGVIGLTRAMALDHIEEGIRVNAVCPGTTDTAMVRAAARRETRVGGSVDETMQKYGAALPGRRIGRPEEVAAVILFLVSSAASMVSGAVVTVDEAATVQGVWASGTGARIE